MRGETLQGVTPESNQQKVIVIGKTGRQFF